MKINEIYLRDFRCFKEIEITFDQSLTVIVGENGAGKTAILDAIAVAFGRLLTKLPKLKGITLKEGDLRIMDNNKPAAFAQYFIKAANYEDQAVRWGTVKTRDSSSKTRTEILTNSSKFEVTGFKEIDAYANQLIDSENADEPYIMPVVVYYGTNRAILEEVKRRRNFKNEFTRFESLDASLNSVSQFKGAFEWFNVMEDLERREQTEQRNFDHTLPELETVRTSIESMLIGFSNPRTEVKPLRFVIDRKLENGATRTYRITQLSDGYRVMLGLAMDLARRMAQANPPKEIYIDNQKTFSKPLDASGIVLIDEIDLHLHPLWQQRVIADLRRTFPNIQFVVTTHSPQVLTTVASESIRVIRHETQENGDMLSTALPPKMQSKGTTSADVMAEIQHVDPVPNIDEAHWLTNYKKLIVQNEHDSDDGEALKEKILNHFGESHQEWLECERLIRLQAIKAKLPKRNQQG
jgi:predicted ATP-binding protein involved in virulence